MCDFESDTQNAPVHTPANAVDASDGLVLATITLKRGCQIKRERHTPPPFGGVYGVCVAYPKA